MEKYIEVMHYILPLLTTMEEGVDYMRKQLAELRYEEAFLILQDVAEGISSVVNAIRPMEAELPENNINTLTGNVTENMSKVVCSYEQGKEINLENQVSEEILPAFRNWKDEIERVLKPYVVS